jgi:hypothetical protein
MIHPHFIIEFYNEWDLLLLDSARRFREMFLFYYPFGPFSSCHFK